MSSSSASSSPASSTLDKKTYSSCQDGSATNSPLKPLHVNFSEATHPAVERKSKYLTAKYGQHQMSLIKKRLQVEMWLLDQLQTLYEDEDKANQVELDLDLLLDIDGDVRRREMLKKVLVDVQRSDDEINQFIEQVLIKAKTL